MVVAFVASVALAEADCVADGSVVTATVAEVARVFSGCGILLSTPEPQLAAQTVPMIAAKTNAR